jgi:3-dehydroquinate synthase
MVLALEFSAHMNLCSPDDARRLAAHLGEVGLPARPDQIEGEKPSLETVMHHIGQDKKVSRGSLTFILSRGIGEAFVARDVPSAEVARFLESRLA